MECFSISAWFLGFVFSLCPVLIRGSDRSDNHRCKVNLCDDEHPKCSPGDYLFINSLNNADDDFSMKEVLRFCISNACGTEREPFGNFAKNVCKTSASKREIFFSCVSGKAFGDLRNQSAPDTGKKSNYRIACSRSSTTTLKVNFINPFVIGLKQYITPYQIKMALSCPILFASNDKGKAQVFSHAVPYHSFPGNDGLWTVTANCSCLLGNSYLWISVLENCALQDINTDAGTGSEALKGGEVYTFSGIPLGNVISCEGVKTRGKTLPTCSKHFTTETVASNTIAPRTASRPKFEDTPGATNTPKQPILEREEETDGTTPAILIGAIGGSLCIAIVLVIVLIVVCKRRRTSQNTEQKTPDDAMGETDTAASPGTDSLSCSESSNILVNTNTNDVLYYNQDASVSIPLDYETVASGSNQYDLVGIEGEMPTILHAMGEDTDTYDRLNRPKAFVESRKTDENADTGQGKLVISVADNANSADGPRHDVIDGCEYAIVEKKS